MKCTSTHIMVTRLSVACHIGCRANERKHPQTIHVSIDCELTKPEIISDKLSDSLDYAEIVDMVQRIVGNQTFHLLEKLAETIAKTVLSKTRVHQLVIRCEKPFKFSACEAVGIERHFTK